MSDGSDLYFQQIPVGQMANLAYLIGSRETGECLVVDPAWSVDALLDRAARWASGGVERFDRDGALAASGAVCEPVLETLLEDPYFAKLPPSNQRSLPG